MIGGAFVSNAAGSKVARVRFRVRVRAGVRVRVTEFLM